MDHRLLDYEQEFLNSYALLKSGCATLRTEDRSAERRRGIARCGKYLQQAESALHQFELETRMPPADGFADVDESSLKSKAANYRQELKEAAQEFRDIRVQIERLMLLVDDGVTATGASSQQRMRLLTAAESTQKGVQMLDSSRVLALETEVLGANIMTELRGQRETLERTSSNVGSVRDGLREATATIQRIVRATLQRKVLIYGLVFLLLLTLTFVSIRKVLPPQFFKSRDSDTSETSSLRVRDKEVAGTSAGLTLPASSISP
ncbi:vesicle transport v-snare protein [Toxoplasma gondii ARI]|uniref:Vesicle transport v-snare protein n=1 Tax=Toxoplasma gondii ARI TaxID=1074872 RepID=A0A139XNY2_TOXGO|nr:vesicle transport v-snare protein [Toxoplasma gondii ARI]